MKKMFHVFAVFLVFLFSGPVAMASLVDASDADRIVDIARGFGSAELEKTTKGDPKLVGRIDGTRYAIFFYGCSNNRNCNDLQFSAAWRRGDKRFTLNKINEWNRTKRYGKAYLDGDGDPVLEMDLNLEYGVTRQNFEETFRYWERALKVFKRDVLGE